MLYFRIKGRNHRWHYPSERTSALLGRCTNPVYESYCGRVSLPFQHCNTTDDAVPSYEICVYCRRRARKKSSDLEKEKAEEMNTP